MSIYNLDAYEIKFSIHAVQRMFERRIDQDDILNVLADSEIIEDYPDDLPLPSMLLLVTINKDPIHIVVASDRENMILVIITLYKPDLNLWNNGFKTRRQKQ